METIHNYNSRRNLGINRLLVVLITGLLTLLVFSCKKDTISKAMSHMYVRMTDAPGNFEAVMVDVQSVEVTGNSGSAVTLNTKAGVYNLLDLANGMDTMIASGDLEAGTVSQIRLILGSNNSVKVNGVIYPLSAPSAMQSGLKLQVHQTFVAGVSYSVLLDFDANQSIVLKGNNEYQLKPVIRTIETALTGSIRGSITPVGMIATVAATSNGMTYSSVTNAKGEFLVAGLPAGTYDITVTPASPLMPVSVIGVVVSTGVATNIGVLTF